jgi:hypothetical protein
MKSIYAFSVVCSRLMAKTGTMLLLASALLLTNFTANAQCSNVTYGGSIGSNQTGNVGFNPATFLNITSPSGGSGTMQYMWLYKNSSTDWVFQAVGGASSATYDCPSINETTTFRRCAKRNGCSTWDGESNDCTVTINCNTCNNLTSGGTIGSNQSGCEGFDAAPINNLTSPSGGTGGLEIMWFYWNASTGGNMTLINGANNLSYDPGIITQDTYFRRCARRQGCTNYDGESNDVFIDVTPCCNATIDQIALFNLDNSTSTAIANGGSYFLGSLPSNWNVEAIVSGSTAESVRFTWSGSYSANNVQNAFPFRSPDDNTALNLGVGTYTLNVKLYSSDDCNGTLCDEETITFTINGCDNLTNGGQIGYDQSGCAGFDPAAFTNVSTPSGGSGTIEYMWLYKNASTGNNFIQVPGANGPTYDAGATYQTTTYRRCARRSYCTSWVGESNDVVITINGTCDEEEICDITGYDAITGRIFWIPNYGTDFRASVSNGGVQFTKYSNGTAHMTGVVERISNTNHKFAIDIWFENRSTFAEWIADGKQAHSPDLGDESSWIFYDFSTTYTNTLVGQGSLAGVTLYLTNQTDIYGLQLGNGANALTTANNGFSSWFSYTGSMSGNGDMNATYNCGPLCSIDIVAGPDQQLCYPEQVTLTSSVTGAANCSIPGVTDCNHLLAASGGWLESPSNSTVCGDNAGTKLWTQYNGTTSFLTLDMGVVLPAGTQICVAMKLEHCQNTSTGYSNAKIQASSNSGSGFVNLTSSVTFSQNTYVEYCYTLASSARYIKVSDNGNCAFRVDYVEYTTTGSNGNAVNYAWSGPGIVGSSNNATIVVNQPGTYTVTVTDCSGCSDTDTVVVTADDVDPVFDQQQSNYDLGCTEAIPYIQPTATDNNGSVTYSYVDVETCNNSSAISCDFRTYTQGGWGAPANGNNPGVYRNNNFAGAFPNGLSIGCASNYALTLTSAQAVQDFLPSGSTPSALPSDLNNPGNSYNNVLAGQLVAVTLALGFDAYDPNFGESAGFLGNQIIGSGTFAGMTISQVVSIANDVIGGCSNAYSYSSLNEVLTDINENFDGGSNHGFIQCVQADASCECTAHRVWTATDACGNTAEFNQYFITGDNEGPIPSMQPADNDVQCLNEVPAAPSVTFSDECGEVIETWMTEEITMLGCSYVITRTWFATDGCNSTVVDQVINVNDTTDPTFDNLPSNSSVECGMLPTGFNISASDNCDDNVEVSQSYSDNGEGCFQTRTFTFVATDNCDNMTEEIRVFSVYDNTAPVLSGVPQNEIVECDNIPSVPSVTATDNCDSYVPVDFSESTTDGCPYTITRTWTATDDCNNETSLSQIITVNDTTDPILHGVPANVIIECDEDMPTYNVWATDNCDEDMVISLTATTEDQECGYIFTRTWTVEDNCGNMAMASQEITVLDTTDPVAHNIPMDAVVECDEALPTDAPTFTDNCDLELTYQPASSISNDECYTVIHQSWTAIDDCGNSTTVSRNINVVDTTDPIVVQGVPAELTIECDQDAPVYLPIFDDNCDENLAVDAISGIANQTVCGYDIQRSWTATDECGNSTTVNQVIHVVDSTNPILVGVPASGTVECDAVPAAPVVTATDNCSEPSLDYTQSMTEGCPYTITRTWTATDACGNETIATQILVVVDTHSPIVVTAPEIHLTVECGTAVEIVAPTFSDNCDEDLTYSFEELEVSGGCVNGLLRTWTATDNCDNTTEFQQIITFIDTTDPTFDNLPVNTTVECDAIPSAPVVTASDLCDSEVDVTFGEVISEGCPYTITRTWTAEDNCYNVTIGTQVITVIDTTYPVLVGVPASMELECDQPAPDAVVTATDNCTNNLVVSLEASTETLACGSTFTRTWSVTDACGNTTTETQVINFVDTTDPYVVNGVPAELTIECDQDAPVYLPTFGDNCDVDVTVTAASGIANQNPCGYDIERSWTATDDCDNSITVYQVIHVVDTTNPMLVGVPANSTVECDAVPAPATVTATDNCSEPTVDYTESMTEGCPYTITRTWTATDVCGNETSASQTILVIDTTAPSLIGVPADAVVECSNIPAAAVVTANDNCDETLEVGYYEQFIPGDACTYTLVRHWEVTDACDNTTSADQILTVTDTTNPTLNNVPSNSTVECDAIPSVPVVTGSDNCDTNVAVSFTETATEGCPYIITRTWVGVDNCGNEVMASQEITVIDTTYPVLVGVPASMELECDQPAPDAVVTATDNCTNNLVVSLEASTETLACGSTFTRTWSVTDACGNTTTETQVINFVDTTDPYVVNGVPAELTIECDQDAPVYLPTFGDNCDMDVTVTAASGIANQNPCGYDIERSWTATDDCDNNITVYQVIHVVDTTNPMLVGVPANSTVECDAVPAPATVTATDNCSEPTVDYTESMTEGCPYTITRTWTATDVCGNETSASQTILVIDTTAPSLIGVPADAVVECSNIPAAAVVTANDNCDETLEVGYYEQFIPGDACTYTLVRHWEVTDACDNTTSADQILTVTDTTNPTLNNVPSNSTVECDAIPSVPVVTGSDNCDTNVAVSFTETATEGCPYIITRTWVGVDNCGNEVMASQEITVIDTTYPVLVGVPASMELECDQPAPDAVVTATDNCTNNLVVSLEASTETLACGSTFTRTWSVTDACGNTTTETQVINFVDTTDPYVVNGVPAELTIECDQDAPVYLPTFGDNCDVDVTVTAASGIANQNPCGYDIERSWTATDDCDNSITVYQVIHVVDTTNPMLVGVPANSTVECDAVPAPATVTATDNCSEPTVEYTESMTEGCPYTITRTWTATDVCGNETSASQTILVIDTTAPSLIGVPADAVVECSNIPAAAVVTANDNCDETLEVGYYEQFIPGDACTYTLVRHWEVTDACDNTTSADQILTVTDTTNPTLNNVPSNSTVECDAIPSVPVVTGSDNCDTNVAVSFTETATEGCPYIITRTWVGVDNCGNEVMASQEITVIDTTYPVLVGVPASMELECDQPAPDAVVTATDNCTNNLVVSLEASTETLACGSTFTRTWSVTDACGNTTTETQVINFVDTTDPYVVNGVPAELTIECDQDAPVYLPTFGDNCDMDVTVTAASGIANQNPCGYDIERSWTATDDCDNNITVYQVIHVVDTTNPMLVGVPANSTVECDAVPAPATVTATDNCSEPTVDYTESMTEGCPYTITRTWTATDVCGNETSASQTILVVDTTNPYLVNNPPVTYSIECGQEIPVNNPVFADNCDENLDVDFEEEMVSGSCPGGYIRTWTATDNCGNNISFQQIIFIHDTTDPSVVVSVPAELTIECNLPIPAFTPEFSDVCSEELTLTSTEEITNETACGYDIERSWTAMDYCENSTTVYQVIHIIDSTDPIISSYPEDMTYECGDMIPAAGEIVVSDNCDTALDINYSEVEFALECGYYLVRTWRVTDDCGNEAVESQYIYVLDETSPILIGVPADLVIECDQPVPAIVEFSATDNCDNDIELDVNEVIIPGECGYQIKRYYSAVDDCGNMTSIPQIITVQDTTDPIIEAPADVVVPCSAIPNAPELSATDNCDLEVTVTYTEVIESGCPYNIVRTWVAVDDCGNTTTVSQMISVYDEVAPVFDAYEPFVYVECDVVGEFILTATDNCDNEVEVTITEENAVSGQCYGSLLRTYRAVDNCGNETFAYQIIDIIDTTAPVIHNVPAEMTIVCGSDIPAPASNIFVTDNCTADIEATFTETQTNEFCPYDIIRTWTALDLCGNVTEETQVIHVVVEVPAMVHMLAYPNPAQQHFTLKFSVPVDQEVFGAIYDLSGRQVLSIYNGVADGGRAYQWDIDAGRFDAGSYTIMMKAGSEVLRERLVITGK